jgi:hypothetical protein
MKRRAQASTRNRGVGPAGSRPRRQEFESAIAAMVGAIAADCAGSEMDGPGFRKAKAG